MTDLYVPLDVNAPDDPKILDAGDHAELVFYRSLCLSKRQSSDGRIARAQLRLLGATEDDVEALVRTDLWAEIEGGWLIVSFLKRNRSRQQLDDARDAEATRKKAYRDKKSQRDATPDIPVASNGTNGHATPSEVKEKRSEVKSSSTPARFAEVVACLTKKRMQKPGITDRDSYAKKVAADIEERHGPKIRSLLRDFPTAPADAIAGHVDGEQTSLRYFKRVIA